MKATTIRHTTEKTIMYMHQASKPLHYTPQTPWRLSRDSTMRGLHLAKPQGTNTTPFPRKAPAVPAPGPGPMELLHKSRESFVRALSWPTAEATAAAPSGPHSGAAAQLPVLSGREKERMVGAETLRSSPGTPCILTARGPSED